MKKNRVNKSTYKMGEIITYQLKVLWQLDKTLVFLQVLNVPVKVLIPLCLVYMPKVVVQEITEQRALPHILISILGIGFALMLLKISEIILEKRIQKHGLLVRDMYVQKAATKAMETDYENIFRPDAFTEYEKVFDAAFHEGDSNILNDFLNVLGKIVAGVIGFTLYTGVLSNLNLWILLIIIAGTLCKFKIWTYIHRWIFNKRDNWLKLDNKLAYLTWKASEYDAAKDIRLYRMKNWFPKIFTKFMTERIRWTITMQLMYYIESITNSLMVFLSNGIAYLYLISCVTKGSMDAAGFVLYFGIITGFTDWCSLIIWNCKNLHQKYLSICDVRNFMNMKDKTNRNKGISLPSEKEHPLEIRFDHVSYCYPGEETPTISDMNLTIAPGEKIALVGTNGAGKTTFVKLLCGLYEPTKGTIFINGKDRSLYNRQDYFTLFSTVFQDSDFLPVSIEHNIVNGENPDEQRVKECIQLSGLSEKIGKLPKGIDTLLEKELNADAVTLSGGEQQKLMLARALYKNAPVLILDEPTAALDPIAESEMYQRYHELSKNKTSVFISHRLASTRFCDRILLIEQGNMIEEGTHEELLILGGKYKEMFDVQSQYYKAKAGDTDEEEY